MPANPPATFGDVGTVKDALKAFVLGPEFEHQLVAVEARFADGLTLPRLTEAQIKTSDTDGVPSVLPLLEIFNEGSDIDNEIEYADKVTHNLTFILWMNGDDEVTVTKLVERFLLALVKTMKHERLMPAVGCIPSGVGRMEYGAVGKQPNVARPFVKAGAITVRLTTIEAA